MKKNESRVLFWVCYFFTISCWHESFKVDLSTSYSWLKYFGNFDKWAMAQWFSALGLSKGFWKPACGMSDESRVCCSSSSDVTL